MGGCIVANIAMRAVEPATRDLQAASLPFKHQNIQQFVTAALLGKAVSSFEEMAKLGMPVVIDEKRTNVADGAYSTWARHLRDDVVEERAEKALRRIHERTGLPLPTDDELKFIKIRVSSTVTSHIRRQGLFVYSQKLLFAPTFEAIGMAVLKEMKVPELPPVSASTAIAIGSLPRLPSHNLKEHLLYLGGQGLGFRTSPVTLAKWIAANQPTVVEFPAPNIEQGESSRVDRFDQSANGARAELGLGFFLATTKDQIGDRMSVLTPMLFNSARAGSPSQPWRAEFLSNQPHLDLMKREERKRLESALADIGRQSARLKVCPICAEVYSDDREDLRLRCTCVARNH
jgi:hypothetical protein